MLRDGTFMSWTKYDILYIEYFMECAYAIFTQSCWRIRNQLSERSPDWLQLIWVWRIATAFQWVYLSMSKIWCNGTRITWFKSLIKWQKMKFHRKHNETRPKIIKIMTWNVFEKMIVKHINYEKNPHQLRKKSSICYSFNRETPAWN